MLTMNPAKPTKFQMRRSIWANNGSWEPTRQCVGAQFAGACGNNPMEAASQGMYLELNEAFGIVPEGTANDFFRGLYPEGVADSNFQHETTEANNNRDEAELIRLFGQKGIELTFVD